MNVFDLFAKLSLDTSEYDKELGDAEQKASGFGGAFASVGKAVGNGLATVAKVGVAAVGTASAAIGALTTKSVEAYSEYEQLVGGVQKLYGNMGQSLEEYAQAQGQSVEEAKAKWQELEDAQNLVQENAKNAYRTAGMSMNDYMDTATSFSAALINSLGGDTLKAAEQTDVAMRAISDNFNTFGGDIEGVKNAFMGFAKQNYTMLDNLKLGYGGTKQGMEQLIADANEYAKSIGQTGDLTIDSFSDIVTAIDLVQQKQNIAGTTAREASTTIQGSLGMVSAAWQNMLTGMADGEADMDSLMSNLVDSIAGTTDEAGNHINGLLDNIIPVAETAISNIGSMIEKIAPVIGEKVPEILGDLVPSLVSAGASLIGSIAKGISDNVLSLTWAVGDAIESLLTGLEEGTSGADSTLLSVLDDIIGGIFENYDFLGQGARIISNIVQGFANSEALEDIGYYVEIFVNTLTKAISENLPAILDAGATIISKLLDGFTYSLPNMIDSVLTMLDTLVAKLQDPSSLKKLVESGVKFIVTLGNGLIKAIPRLVKMIPQVISGIVSAITDNLPVVMDGVMELVNGIVTELPNLILAIGEALPEIIKMLADYLVTNLPILINGIVTMIDMIAQNLPDIIDAIVTILPDLIGAIVDAMIACLPVFIQGTITLVTALAERLPEICMALIEAIPQIIAAILVAFEPVVDGIGKVFGDAWANIQDVFSKVPDWFKGKFDEAKNGIKEVFDKTKDNFQKAWEAIKTVFATVGTWFKAKFETAVSNIKKSFETIGSFFEGIWTTIKEAFHIDDAIQWGKDMIANFVDGIKKGWGDLKDGLGKLGQQISDFIGFSEPKEGPLSNFHTYAPDMLKLFADGVNDNANIVTDAVANAFDFSDLATAPTMEYNKTRGGYATDGGAMMQKVVDLLQEIVNRGVDVELAYDPDGIFRVVERQNKLYTATSGYNRLSMTEV